MKAGLVGLGLALFCTIHAAVYDIDRCNHKKLLGDWHVLALATDCQWLGDHLEDMTIVAATLNVTEDGVFRITSNFPTPFGCFEVEADFKRREDGKFASSSGWGDQVIDVMETDCRRYVIATTTWVRDGNVSKFVTLYSRGLRVRPWIEKKFKKKTKELGFTKEQIKVLPGEVACTETQ